MTYCRIDLSQTNYKEMANYKLLDEDSYDIIVEIYKKYCQHKKFHSVLPIFFEDISSPYSEVLGYFDNETVVAFSLITVYPSHLVASCEQFAWDYADPKLKLGYRSLRSECARYKRLGYKYLYLGEYADYKTKFAGFEIVGKLDA